MRVSVWLLSLWLALSPALADSAFVAPTATGTATTGQIPGTATNDSASAGNVGEYPSGLTSLASSTVTITIASPGVISWTAHGLGLGSAVTFTTTGALPTGITASTVYWVIAVNANSFQIATTPANAIAGTAINTSGTQSGTQTGSSTVSLSTGTGANVAFVNLTAGDWDVRVHGVFSLGTTTNVTYLATSLSSTSATFNGSVGRFAGQQFGTGSVIFNASLVTTTLDVAPFRVSLTSTTPYYCVLQSGFTVSTNTGSCLIEARRPR